MASASEILKAYLHCARTPAEDAVERIRTQLKKQYGAAEVELTVSVEPDLISGYVLQVGGRVFDNSGKSALAAITADAPSLAVMQTRVEDYKPAATTAEGGTVISAADGVVDVKGMDQAVYGEIVTFDNGAKGMVESVEPDHLGIMLFDKIEEVGVGTLVTRSGKRAGIPVGDGFLGRVISPLGEPIDGKGPIEAEGYNPIEKQAPGILERQSVDTPLHTGILAIDSMFPIGRGQRELIIGDRQTGKTSIATDAILNQKDKDVLCIYVAIGQKASSIARVAGDLQKHGAAETYRSLPPLFSSREEYEAFRARHAKATVPQVPFGADYAAPVHIGVDSGSTTVKLVVIDQDARILIGKAADLDFRLHLYIFMKQALS